MSSDPTPDAAALDAVLTAAGLTAPDRRRLVELDEGIWWSRGAEPELDLIRRACAGALEQGGYSLVALHLLAVVNRAWELTWDHTAMLDIVAAAITVATGADDDTEVGLTRDLLRAFEHDLALETATSTTALAQVWSTADAALRHVSRLARRARVPGEPGPVADFVATTADARVAYLRSVGRAAGALLDHLTGRRDDLDGAVAELAAAETEQLEETCRSELRAHRAAVEAVRAARDRDWLRIDDGRIVIVVPFGLRGPAHDDVVATVRAEGGDYILGGVPLDNSPTELLLVDDIWRGHDPLDRSYQGTQLDLPTLLVPPSDGRTGPLELSVSIVVSQLGNHHVRVEIPLVDALPHTVAYATWLAAPEFGALTELGSGIGFAVTGTRTWPRLADAVRSVLLDLTEALASSHPGLELSARPGMNHVISVVHRASALPGGDASAARPVDDAAELRDLFGAEILTHPIPSGVGALASWATYASQGRALDTSALSHELLVVNVNHTVLASFHSPYFMVQTVREAIEFVVSLDGLFAAWQDDLAYFYEVLRNDVRILDEQITRGDVVTPQRYTQMVDKLDRDQIRLRTFTTRARVSLLFIASPSLVTSPVIRATIDELLETSVAWSTRHELTRTADQGLGDRLSRLIDSWSRRREESAHERQEQRGRRADRLAQTVLAVLTGIGVSGVFAIVQSGFGWQGLGAVVLAVLVVAIAVACGVFYWRVSRQTDEKRIDGGGG